MTQDLFRQDAYLTECTATVTAADGRRFSTTDAGLTWRRN